MNTTILSPVDYLFTGAGSQPITFAFYYHDYLDLKKMKDGLDYTLKYFPLLPSQLIQVSEFEYQYLLQENGLLFETHQADSTFQNSDNIEKYIIPVNSVPGQPLSKIALIRTSRGSVLAVSISHALVDGYSYFHFLSSWARVCRGENFIQPSLDRKVFVQNTAETINEVDPLQLYTRGGLFYTDHSRHQQPVQSHPEKIYISDATIRSSLEELNKESQLSFTVNDLITAMLWQKYLPGWTREIDDPDTFITCPFDFRRVLTDFPKNYFGCALCFATASIDLLSLRKASLGELALLIRNSVTRIKDDHILSSMQTLENFRRQKGIAVMENIHLRHPLSGMIVTNLTRLPIADLDFGKGAPTAFLTYAEVSRSAAILPARGGVELMVVHPAS